MTVPCVLLWLLLLFGSSSGWLMATTTTPFCYGSTRSWRSLSAVAIKVQRRDLARMLSSMTTDQPDKNDSSSQLQQPQPPPKRRYRPGYNSYLKVLLEDTIVTSLYEATLELRDYCVVNASTASTAFINASSSAELGGDETTPGISSTNEYEIDADTATEGDSSSSLSQPLQGGGGIKLKPRSLTSLHLTLLFGGEVWGELSAPELEQWHARISRILAQSGFSQIGNHDVAKHPTLQEPTQQKPSTFSNSDDNKNNESGSNSSSNQQQQHGDYGRTEDDYWIRFDRLATFPPRRNNLIVALFEVSPAWQALYKDLVATLTTQQQSPSSADNESDALRQVAQKSHGTWTPHMTLANIIVRGKQRGSHMQALRAQLDQASLALATKLGSSSLQVRGISMGGPVPSQVALNWDFAPPSE